MENLLKKLYYDSTQPAGFGGVKKLYRIAKSKNSRITRHFVKEWLKGQEVYTLHKGIRHKFPRNRTVVGFIDQQWQIDLVDLRVLKEYNNNHAFILVVIDVLSKYAWARKLKTKKGTEVTSQFKDILKTGSRRPQVIQADKSV